MITVTAIFGEDAVKEYKSAGQIPSDEWLIENGGVVKEKTFHTKKEYAAYMEGVNDTAKWSDSHFLEPEITPDNNIPDSSFAKKGILASIKSLLQSHNLTELDLTEVDDPTYVIWWDNKNYPYEGEVLKIHFDGNEISIKVETEDSTVTLYESDPALESLEWLTSIHDNMIAVLQSQND